MREHRAALVEGGDLSAQVPREEAGAAGDVERACRRERRDHTLELGPLLVPSRPVAVGERAAAEPPVVVLAGARVVVGLHAPRVFRCSNPSRTSRRDAKRRRSRRSRPRSRRRRGCWTSTQIGDHNRSVFTVVGDEDQLADSLVAGVACARERIDLRRHEGAHPRIGAADVVPLVPLRPDGDGPGEGGGARGRGADRGRARAVRLPLRRVCSPAGAPRSSAAAARRSCSGASTRASSRRTSGRPGWIRQRAEFSSARGVP